MARDFVLPLDSTSVVEEALLLDGQASLQFIVDSLPPRRTLKRPLSQTHLSQRASFRAHERVLRPTTYSLSYKRD